MQAHTGFIHWRNIVAISDIPPERLGKVTHVTGQIIVPKAGQAVLLSPQTPKQLQALRMRYIGRVVRLSRPPAT